MKNLIRTAAAIAAMVGVAAYAAPALAISALSALGQGSCGQTDMATGDCVAVSGNANAGVLGSGTFSFTLTLASDSTDNGVGGECRIASGIGALAGGNATINLDEVGYLCDMGAHGTSPQAFEGSFYVTSATGLIMGATGSGSVIWTVDETGGVIVSALGSGNK